MKPCIDRRDTIVLAAYDELNPEQRRDLERHMAGCPGCRAEYESVLRVLGRIKESMPVPELSEKRASSILWSVKRELGKEGAKPSWWRQWLVSRGRLVPALATACLVLITVGWFGMYLMHGSGSHQESIGPVAENHAVVRDLEVISNIEFLEELDTVQELVTVLDRNESI